MSDFTNGFNIDIKYKDHTEKQKFAIAKGDDALCLYQQGFDNAILMIEPKKREFTIDNSSHMFDAISTKDVIIIDNISNVSAQYNTDFTITVDTEKGKQTFKISHNDLSIKDGTSFKSIATFDKPLDITLPESLPSQIANGNIKMSSFPAQMANMFVNDYNYKTLTLKNGLKILKSPDGKIIFPDGAKLSTSTLTDIVRAPSGLVLRLLPSTEMSKMMENRMRKGIRITEEDAKAFINFSGMNIDLNNIPVLASDSAYKKVIKPSATYRKGKEEAKADNLHEELKIKASNAPDKTKDATNEMYSVNLDESLDDLPNIEDSNWNVNESSMHLQDSTLDMHNKVENETEDKNTENHTNLDANNQNNMYTVNLDNGSENLYTTNFNDMDIVSNDNSKLQETTASHNSDSGDSDANSGGSDPNSITQPSQSPLANNNKNHNDDNPSGFTANENKDQKAPPQSIANNDQKQNKTAEQPKKSDDSKSNSAKKEMNEKQAAMIHKGVRFILLVATANFFMAAFMLGNPIFALIATMCVAGMAMSATMQQFKVGFSPIFSIGKDFKDWIKAKHSIKELSNSERRTLNRLSKKAMKKGLNKRQQKKLDMLSTRADKNLSYDEYKTLLKSEKEATKMEKLIQDLPAFYKINELRDVMQKQDQDFYSTKAEHIEKIDNQIIAREKFLNKGKNVIPEKQRDLLKEDIQKLKEYRTKLSQFQNPVFDSNQNNLNATETELRSSALNSIKSGQQPNNWLDNAPEIDERTFDDLVAENGLESPNLHYDDEILKSSETDLLKRVNERKTNLQKHKDDKTAHIKDDDEPTFTPTIIS